MLEVNNISTGYGKKQVLFDVSFSIQKGEAVLLIGSNGSGKSTLLKRVYGLLPKFIGTEGSIQLNRQDITTTRAHDMIKRGLLYIPQKNNCYENMTVQENLEISALTITNRAERRQRIDATLEGFAVLQPLLKLYAAKLSGGERQLMVLAMAMQHQPDMLLIDEPFAALSGRNIDLVKEKISDIKSRGITLLIVEHRIREAIPLTDRVYGLKLGRMHELKQTDNIYEDKIFSDILI